MKSTQKEKQPQKESYEKPELKKEGSLRDITANGTSGPGSEP